MLALYMQQNSYATIACETMLQATKLSFSTCLILMYLNILFLFHSSNSQFILQHKSPNSIHYQRMWVWLKILKKLLHVLANEISLRTCNYARRFNLLTMTKFCQTFPPLYTNATGLLLHLGKLCLGHGQLELVIET